MTGKPVVAAKQTVRLVTGDTVVVSRQGGRPAYAYRAVHHSGIGATSSTSRVGSRTYVVPGEARRYLGSVLDPSLFAVIPHPARLPVSITLSDSSAHPSAPGLVITSRSGTRATGYLDTAHASDFGAALIAQWQRDARAHRTSTTIMGGLRHLARAGVTAPVHPDYPLATLTLKGGGGEGQPADDVFAGLINVDDGRKYVGFVGFANGHAKVSVPKGHYSLIAEFDQFTETSLTTQIVFLPDFNVTTNQQQVVPTRGRRQWCRRCRHHGRPSW